MGVLDKLKNTFGIDEEDEDEDKPILQEIKGPDLAVSTRFS